MLLCGCQQLLKVVGCRVQYSWRLFCTRALRANPHCWPEQELQLSLAESGFHTHRGLGVMQLLSCGLETNILKIWKKKSQAVTLQKEANQFLIPPHPTTASSHQCGGHGGTGGTRPLHSFLLSPNAKFSHLREEKGTEVNFRLLHVPQNPVTSPRTGCRWDPSSHSELKGAAVHQAHTNPFPCPIPTQH